MAKAKQTYEKLKDRARFRRRAAVEPIIGHLKSDYRLLRNHLKGVESDMINNYGSRCLQYDEKINAVQGYHLFCPGYIGRQLVNKIRHCTELLKSKTS